MADTQTNAASSAAPAEVLFYHLERQPLERVLPNLLARTLERGWKAVAAGGKPGSGSTRWIRRCATDSDDSFLPHGQRKAGYAEEQPVFLTTGPENPMQPGVRFGRRRHDRDVQRLCAHRLSVHGSRSLMRWRLHARNGQRPRTRAAPSPIGSRLRKGAGSAKRERLET